MVAEPFREAEAALQSLVQLMRGVPDARRMACQPDRKRVAVACARRPGERSAQVVELGPGILVHQPSASDEDVVQCAQPFEQRFGMQAQGGGGFAGFPEAFEGISPRGLEQPIAGHRLALGQHQRLVHQRAKVIERSPAVDLRIPGDVLRGFQREAAGEHAQAAEHALLLGGEQAMTPLERRSQRLVPAEHCARSGGEHVEALAEPRAQAFDAEQRHAGGRELDGQRNAVEPAADLDDRFDVVPPQDEVRRDSLRTRGEELDRACTHRLAGRIAAGHGQHA